VYYSGTPGVFVTHNTSMKMPKSQKHSKPQKLKGCVPQSTLKYLEHLFFQAEMFDYKRYDGYVVKQLIIHVQLSQGLVPVTTGVWFRYQTFREFVYDAAGILPHQWKNLTKSMNCPTYCTNYLSKQTTGPQGSDDHRFPFLQVDGQYRNKCIFAFTDGVYFVDDDKFVDYLTLACNENEQNFVVCKIINEDFDKDKFLSKTFGSTKRKPLSNNAVYIPREVFLESRIVK
jgi:hypothetical protein